MFKRLLYLNYYRKLIVCLEYVILIGFCFEIGKFFFKIIGIFVLFVVIIYFYISYLQLIFKKKNIRYIYIIIIIWGSRLMCIFLYILFYFLYQMFYVCLSFFLNWEIYFLYLLCDRKIDLDRIIQKRFQMVLQFYF